MPSRSTYCLSWVSLTLTWDISSRLLQQSVATAPYFGQGVSPQCCPSWTWTWSSSSPSEGPCRSAWWLRWTMQKLQATHQHTSYLKSSWANSPLDEFPGQALPTKWTISIFTHQWAPTSPSNQKGCMDLLDSIIQQRADSRSKKHYTPTAWRTKTTITENCTKWVGRRICPRWRNKIKTHKDN